MEDLTARPGDASMRADKLVFERQYEWRGALCFGVSMIRLKMLIAKEIEDAVAAEHKRMESEIQTLTGPPPTRRLGVELPVSRPVPEPPTFHNNNDMEGHRGDYL